MCMIGVFSATLDGFKRLIGGRSDLYFLRIFSYKFNELSFKKDIMKVVFIKDVPGIGRKGEVKNVKEGFYKNFLQRQGAAVIATDGKVREAQNIVRNQLISKERIEEQAKEINNMIDGQKIEIKRKTKEEKLYGSVTEKDIIEAVEKAFNVRLEKKHLKLREHIKTTGEYPVEVLLSDAVKSKITIEVSGE